MNTQQVAVGSLWHRLGPAGLKSTGSTWRVVAIDPATESKPAMVRYELVGKPTSKGAYPAHDFVNAWRPAKAVIK